jgi:divalent metal cation (Fe/Co/Zn/Cd) transporter
VGPLAVVIVAGPGTKSDLVVVMPGLVVEKKIAAELGTARFLAKLGAKVAVEMLVADGTNNETDCWSEGAVVAVAIATAEGTNN